MDEGWGGAGGRKTPVTVLAGFLGAGKTTVLEALLDSAGGTRIAVAVNDVAALNVDANKLAGRASAEVALQNGCVCCNLGRELLTSVDRLCTRKPGFDAVVVELSGVAEPARIAALFATAEESNAPVSRHASLARLVTVVDAKAFPALMRSGEAAAKRTDLGGAAAATDATAARRGVADLLAEQVEVADVVLVNKADTVSAEQLAQVFTTVRGLNPGAEVISTSFGKVPTDKVLALDDGGESAAAARVADPADGTEELDFDTAQHEARFEILSAVYERTGAPFHPRRLAELLESAKASMEVEINDDAMKEPSTSLALRGLLRAKGIVWIADAPGTARRLAGAGGRVELHADVGAWGGPIGEARQELVVIGCGLNTAGAAAALDAALLTPEELRIFESDPAAFTGLEGTFPVFVPPGEGGEHVHTEECAHDDAGHGPPAGAAVAAAGNPAPQQTDAQRCSDCPMCSCSACAAACACAPSACVGSDCAACAACTCGHCVADLQGAPAATMLKQIVGTVDDKTSWLAAQACAKKEACLQACCDEAPSREVWVRRALVLAIFTVVWNVCEGSIAVTFGLEEESIALFGFGLDSFVEVFSASFVLWRFAAEAGLRAVDTPAAAVDAGVDPFLKERRATLAIGYLLLLLAAFAVGGGVFRLVEEERPGSGWPGLTLAAISLSFMGILWQAKLLAATALRSRTLEKDALCSWGCLRLSAILFVGAGAVEMSENLWWVDPAASILMACIFAKEGYDTVSAARSPDFDGCACCTISDTPGTADFERAAAFLRQLRGHRGASDNLARV